MPLIIDGHVDLCWHALNWGRDLRCSVAEINRREAGMTDHVARGHALNSLHEMRSGRIALCLATVLAGADPDFPHIQGHNRLSSEYPCQEMAYAVAQGQLAYYRLLEKQGEMAMIRTATDLDAHWNRWLEGGSDQLPIGYVLAMEGADPIVDPRQAEAWWNQGLRCASLVHFGRSHYAVGTGKDGPLTADGVALLAEFQRLGIILDVTHLSETSFSQTLDCFDGPVVATHSNCRQLVPGDRQLSDEQLGHLIAREAVVGVCLDNWMLCPGWQASQTSREVVGLAAMADHIDHICQLAGDCLHVGFGTDADGGCGSEQAPRDLESTRDLARLAGILAARGYPEADIANVFHGNWLRFLLHHLPLDEATARR
jgi:membrane dipeptidase